MRSGILIVLGALIIAIFGGSVLGAWATGQSVLGVDFISSGSSSDGVIDTSTVPLVPTSASFSCPDCRWFLFDDSSWLQKLAPSGVKVDEFYSETIMGRRYTSILGAWYVWSVFHPYEVHNCNPDDPITPLADSNPSNPTHWGCPLQKGGSFLTYPPSKTIDTKVVWKRADWYEYHTQGILPPGVTGGLQSLIVEEISYLTSSFHFWRYAWYLCQEYMIAGYPTLHGTADYAPHGGVTIDTSYCKNAPYNAPILDGWGGTHARVDETIERWNNPSSIPKGSEPHTFAENVKASEEYFGDSFHYSYDSIKASCQGWFLPYSAMFGCFYGGSQQTHIVISLIKSTVAEGWNNPNPETVTWFEGTVTTGSSLRAVSGLPCGDVVADQVATSVTYVYKCQVDNPFTFSRAVEPGSTYGSTVTIDQTETVAGTWLPTSTTEEHYSDSDLANLKSYMAGLGWTDRIVLARIWTYLSYRNVDCVSYGLTGKFTRFLGSGNPNDLWDATYGMPSLYCTQAAEHGWSSSYVVASCSTDDMLGSVGAGANWTADCQTVTTGCSYGMGNNAQQDANRRTLAQKHARVFTQVTCDASGHCRETEYAMWISDNGNPVAIVHGQTTTIGVFCSSGPNCVDGKLQAGFTNTDSAGKTYRVWNTASYDVVTTQYTGQDSPYVTTVATHSYQVTHYGTNQMLVARTTTENGIVKTYAELVDYVASTDPNGAVHTMTYDSEGNAVDVKGPEYTAQNAEGKDITYEGQEGGNQNLNNLNRCIKAGGTIEGCGFELMPYMLIPVGTKTTGDMRELQLFYDQTTGTFVAIDISGTYFGGSVLMALLPDNPQMYGGLDLPSAPHFALTGQWPYLSVQVASETTMYAYWFWAPFLVLSPILLVVGLLLRRHDRKERGL
jgi:hypothetical protein